MGRGKGQGTAGVGEQWAVPSFSEAMRLGDPKLKRGLCGQARKAGLLRSDQPGWHPPWLLLFLKHAMTP